MDCGGWTVVLSLRRLDFSGDGNHWLGLAGEWPQVDNQCSARHCNSPRSFGCVLEGWGAEQRSHVKHDSLHQPFLIAA